MKMVAAANLPTIIAWLLSRGSIPLYDRLLARR